MELICSFADKCSVAFCAHKNKHKMLDNTLSCKEVGCISFQSNEKCIPYFEYLMKKTLKGKK